MGIFGFIFVFHGETILVDLLSSQKFYDLYRTTFLSLFYNDEMRYIILLLLFSSTIISANLGTFDKDGRFIYPETNKPYTGNLDVINNDWGSGVVEFNKNYVDGILHGHEKVFYKSGKLKSIGNFNQGKVDGNVKLYYEDGSIQGNVYFNNGIKEGRAVSYYPNGSKQLEQFFRNDVLDGLRRTWYENGNIMESTPYSKGLVHGMLETYYETGGIFERVKYDYGTPKFMRVYSEDGTLSEEKGFFDRKVIEQIIG
jgi:antitoxin component YwqK of YwqJK toxin-antitoxin module